MRCAIFTSRQRKTHPHDDYRTSARLVGAPTGYFTHGRIYDPNPLANAPESPERMEALESRLFVSGLEDFVERVEGARRRAAS